MAKRAAKKKRTVPKARPVTHRRHNPSSIAASANYSHGIEVMPSARFLAIAGQVGRDANGRVPGTIEEQATLAWANVKAVLKEAGMEMGDLVHYFSFLVRREDSEGYDKARVKALGTTRPASTKVFISGLARPELLCEVQAFAAKAGRAVRRSR
jgi:enamine deaminase RidA (YjgF/YER057c/UK114 family)